jgi:flavin reductase (DIM6/NTAB) family NADH-FMN oxidoreductase RutF
MSVFAEIKPQDIPDNIFKLIGLDWMLVTAGTRESFNMMTASWGGMGILWNKNIAICFVRPHRYTYDFMERADCFTLSFFGEDYRDALNLCGSKSGRQVNKVAATGLTPIAGETGAIYFAEARLVLECRKIYYQDLDPANFVVSDIHKNYPTRDYHRMYLGEIVHCLARR